MISIIVPVYNTSKYISACLESCLSQSFDDFEIIIVNDGSMDKSSEILEKYAQKDSRIIVINKENEGLVHARKTGIAKARGEHIFFLDSDDTITPDALEKLWTEVQSSNCDIIVGKMVMVLKSGRIIADNINRFIYADSEQSLLCSILAKSILPSLCGRLIRKRLFEKITLPYEYTIGEDVITNIKIIKTHNPTLSIVNCKIYNYIQHRGSMINANTAVNADRRMKYMVWVYEYLKSIKRTEELDNCIAKFFIEEYFTFLRDGGVDCYPELKERIYKEYIKNKWAVSQTASWRLILVKMYQISPTLGLFLRWIIVSMRKIAR